MREILKDVERWQKEGLKVAIATVVKIYGSAPRPLGAKLAVSSGGDIVGSVSGGCVEGAVVEEAREVIESGTPKLVKFGITDEQAWTVGLTLSMTFAVILFVFGLVMQGIDNWAHLGGFGGGYLMAKWLDPLAPERTDHQIAALLCIGLTIVSVIISITTGFF